MHRLFAIGLAVCTASSAAAQTEVIIRRPGEADQVIHLDSARAKEALAKARVDLQKATTAIEQRVQEMQGELNGLRLTQEPLRLNTLALRNGALAAESLLAPMFKDLAAIWRQPHLGVVVATAPRETDKYGAYINAVTPGSPAEKAGIMSGDIIMKLAGKSLTEKDAKDDSGPGLRLISIIATLTVGKPVELELRRGTQNKTLKITPIEDDGGAIAKMAPSVAQLSRLPMERLNQTAPFGGDMPGRMALEAPQFNVFSLDNGGLNYSFGNNGLFASYELAPLNAKLGAYFGTSDGVLVVNTGAMRGAEEASTPATAPRASAGRVSRDTALMRTGNMTCDTASNANSSTISCRGTGGAGVTYIDGAPGQSGYWARRQVPVNIGLEPGDVIVSVDGRKVSNPSQLMRIVGTYEHNDEFKLQIMRQKHAETLTVKMP
jgi:membrane-associated protease RseP (regulator of RpoE activity)